MTVKVGPYTVRTGKDGRFDVQLPPGDVRLALDLTSLPIQYQVEGPLERTVTLAARHNAHADFPVVASAALTGSVLLDSDGNGAPDTPPKSGEAPSSSRRGPAARAPSKSTRTEISSRAGCYPARPP